MAVDSPPAERPTLTGIEARRAAEMERWRARSKRIGFARRALDEALARVPA